MLESAYQAYLIQKLKDRYPGCVVLKTDPSYIQGFPDLQVLVDRNWGSLETKATLRSKKRPNQQYYVDKLNEMSFASFICPENEEEVLDAFHESFFYSR